MTLFFLVFLFIFCICHHADGLFWPVFVIATLAAMIASQAMISATFSCIKQSMALGCFPRLKIIHTSRKRMGQIYIPVINWFLMIMCVVVVATFRRTTGIANAYGNALEFSGQSLYPSFPFSCNAVLLCQIPQYFNTIEILGDILFHQHVSDLNLKDRKTLLDWTC